jgi:arylamine N-acetyltransferase
MVTLASIGGKTYHIDVGFANFGTLAPLPLEENAQTNCVPGLEARLVKRSIADNVTDQKLWVLETRDVHSNEWKAGYCFSEVEFLPQDFYTLNFRTMTDPSSWFTTTFIITRILLDESDESAESRPLGTLTMVGTTLQRRLDGGKAEVLLECRIEEERVQALEKWFFVKLTDDEIRAIKGSTAAI